MHLSYKIGERDGEGTGWLVRRTVCAVGNLPSTCVGSAAPCLHEWGFVKSQDVPVVAVVVVVVIVAIVVVAAVVVVVVVVLVV